MDSPVDSISRPPCAQKLQAANIIDSRVLELLSKCNASNVSDASQVAEVLTSCREIYEGETFSTETLMALLKVAESLLLQAPASSQAMAALLVFASKIQECFDSFFSSSNDEVLEGLQPSQTIAKSQTVLVKNIMLAIGLFTNLEKCLFLETELRNEAAIYICKFLDSFRKTCIFFQGRQKQDEFQKMAQEVLGEVLKVLMKLREVFIKSCGQRSFESLDSTTLKRADVIWYGVCAFMELGKFAALNGRLWVGMLNVAWKGVTALLHTMARKDALCRLFDIRLIIKTMIGCATRSLANAAESWNAALQEADDRINVAELKRLCIPVKFFLINATRVITLYPCQAIDEFKNVAACALKIITLRLEMSDCFRLRFAAETIVETLEPSLFILLRSVLSSSELEFQVKLQLLTILLAADDKNCLIPSNNANKDGLDDEANEGEQAKLQLSRLIIFLGLLQVCQDCGHEVCQELASRLDFCLQLVCRASIYAKIFESHLSTTPLTAKANWQSVYITLLRTLETFLVSLAEKEAWAEVEEFLYRNVLHPHFLCRELILDLWCFVSRHSEAHIVGEYIQDLLHLLSELVKSNSTCSEWPVKTIARLVCLLIKADSNNLVIIQVYEQAFGRDPFATSLTARVASALLTEHFPISSLPVELKSRFIVSAKRALAQSWNELTTNSTEASGKLQLVDETLFSLMEFLYQENFEISSDSERLRDLAKMSIDLLEMCRNSDCGIRSQSLKYLSGIWQKLQPEEIESIIVPLHDLILTNDFPLPEQAQLKLGLAEALAGLGDVSMPEDDRDPTNRALWELYHMILKERHWGYAHLALASFGYFVAHTSWNELWRFVPTDAALAYDGNAANESTFMASLRCFLEKEVVCTKQTKSDKSELLQEGELLERAHLEFSQIADSFEAQGMVGEDGMDVDSNAHTDPVESSALVQMNEAMKMLQEGVSFLREKLPAWLKESARNVEQERHMQDQLCMLADMIGQFGGILQRL